MFAILAAVAYLLGFIEQGSGSHTSAWFSPMAMLLIGSFFLVLHVAGVDRWIPRP
ncbi:hypothetical protein Caci_2867 [Catenulispora acidiphila DSM 44928]|uniref:Uncharacterized protein n=1 Tax=Catenulispora acidiphila (strain DSM 44928 / JCM 14897 / NBRC 102108 / NRRL B-24433 / ID139908) TaxID=479433 RepID=C7Q1A1_CATAD|nr:hypothetical protein [Catenulispora acidiphila]ACU71776.1 hypothetical protein Caci_2867 [Catenulispora acidiphila DSM 44928]